MLSSLAGLKRVGVNLMRIAPGKESFIGRICAFLCAWGRDSSA